MRTFSKQERYKINFTYSLIHYFAIFAVITDRRKSKCSTPNYTLLLLHKPIKIAIFASRTNVYRWFTDTFFQSSLTGLQKLSWLHRKAQLFYAVESNRLIIWRSQVQALAGPQEDFHKLIAYGSLFSCLVRLAQKILMCQSGVRVDYGFRLFSSRIIMLSIFS